MTRAFRISALAASLATLACATPTHAADAASHAAWAACRAASRASPAEFDGLVRVSTCQRVTAKRLRQRLAAAKAPGVQTARADAATRAVARR